MTEGIGFASFNLDEDAETYLQAAHLLGVEAGRISAAAQNIARQPFQAAAALGFVLSQGLYCLTISPADPVRLAGPDGLDYLGQLWLEQGIPQEYIDIHTPQVLATFNTKHVAYSEAVQPYPQQHRYANRPASHNDVDFALAQGAIVVIDLHDERISAASSPILAAGREDAECYLGYWPESHQMCYWSTTQVAQSMWPTVGIISRQYIEL